MANELPADFVEALKDAGLVKFFADCTPPHQHEYLKWVAEAKRPETRRKRIAQATKMIAAKRDEDLARPRKKPSR